MDNIIKLSSISKLHELSRKDKPKHPLITLIDFNNTYPNRDYAGNSNIQIAFDFYCILYKKTDCSLTYGRKSYDFNEGSILFMAPNQSFTTNTPIEIKAIEGWMLCFHPDLIRKNSLGSKIHEYTFFSYNENESLHLSDHEKSIITNIVMSIKEEYSQNIDIYSNELIVSNLELLLNHAKRFYGRQFITRSAVNSDAIGKFDKLVREYLNSSELEDNGLPTVKHFASKMGYSPNYLSDLIKKETGKNAQEHIQFQLLEKAKNMLVGTSSSISEISYVLGFKYPSHFSKFFKSKIGVSPNKYRQ